MEVAVTSQEPSPNDRQDRGLPGGERKRRPARSRKTLKRLYCPLHPEQAMLRCSVKRHLARNTHGALLAAPSGRLEGEEWALGFGMEFLNDQWLETLLCPLCGRHRTWHVLDEGNNQFRIAEVPSSVRQQLGNAAVLIPVTVRQPLHPGDD